MGKGFWLLLLLIGMASAQVDPAWVAQALKRSIPLGDLSAWEGLPQYPVRLSNTYPPKPVAHEGYFSVAWDENHLYFLGVFQQDAETVRAELPADHQEWWKDDTMEIFLRTDPKNKAAPALHLAVNPKGTRFKAYTFTDRYRSLGRIEAQRWVVELAIPLGEVLPRPKVGEVWNLKVGREHQAAAEYPLWPMGGDYHSPENFGYLVFTEDTQDNAELARRIQEFLGAEPPIPSRLQGITSYAVYYSRAAEELAKLVNFDLAILQPDLPLEALSSLKANGVKTLAYLSIGEVEPGRDYGQPIPQAWILGQNPNWGSFYVDASQPGWQDLVLSLARRYLERGFSGLFLDTLDTADLYPQAASGLVQIVKRLREAFPEAILVQNRGFRLLPQTAPYLDGVMYENLSAMYRFDQGRYVPVDSDPSPVLPYLKRGLVVLALDYAPPEDKALVERCYVRARELGFIPYVSTIQLDRVYLLAP